MEEEEEEEEERPGNEGCRGRDAEEGEKYELCNCCICYVNVFGSMCVWCVQVDWREENWASICLSALFWNSTVNLCVRVCVCVVCVCVCVCVCSTWVKMFLLLWVLLCFTVFTPPDGTKEMMDI